MIVPCAEFWKGSTLIAAVISLSAPSAVASQLSVPGNLRVADFSATTLSLSADEVPGATGYAFEVVRLEGVPETEIRENFALAPSLSAPGWALSSSNAKLEYYEASGYYDTSTSDQRALKIDRQSSVGGDVAVGIETPVCTAAIHTCSFVCKVGAAGENWSDVFRVMGRTNPSSEWMVLNEFVPVDIKRTNVTVSVNAAANVRQVKFVFAASAATIAKAAWDSLSVVYGGGETRTEVLKGISTDIDRGEICVLFGPSGSGKSTFLNMVGGLEPADGGSIRVGDTDICRLKDRELVEYRRRELGFIFQFYNLVPDLTVRENIEVCQYLSKDPLPIDDLLNSLGLWEHRGKCPNQVSGGQQQRCAIGRALVKNPSLLLCDEPTGALDYHTSKEILELMERINREYHSTMVIVTHNDAIRHMSHHILRLRDGQLSEDVRNDHLLPARELTW